MAIRLGVGIDILRLHMREMVYNNYRGLRIGSSFTDSHNPGGDCLIHFLTLGLQ
jgi:hypothetical protein